jgi:hypothetical protein
MIPTTPPKSILLAFSLILGIGYITFLGAPMQDLINKPYVFRQLVPLVALPVYWLTHIPYIHLMHLVVSLSWIGLAWALTKFYSGAMETTHDLHKFVIVSLILVMFISLYPAHTYDIPNLMVFYIALILLQRDRIWELVLFFPILCFSKETAMIFIPVVTITLIRRNYEKASIFFLSGIMAAIWLLVRLFTLYQFRDYPGNTMDFTLLENLRLYTSNAYVGLATGLVLLSLWTIFRLKWGILPKIVQDTLSIYLPITAILYLIGGMVLEFRVFLEVIPLIVLASMCVPSSSKEIECLTQ